MEVLEAMIAPTVDGQPSLPKRSGPKGLLPSTWLERTSKVDYAACWVGQRKPTPPGLCGNPYPSLTPWPAKLRPRTRRKGGVGPQMGVCRATKANGEPCTLPTNSLDPRFITSGYPCSAC